MAIVDNFSCLPFYEATYFTGSSTNWNHKNYLSGYEIFPLISRRDYLLPICIDMGNVATITSASVVNYDTGVSQDILSKLALSLDGTTIYNLQPSDIDPSLISSRLTTDLVDGQYYVQIGTSNLDYTSEIFYATNKYADCIKLEFYDLTDWNIYPYSNKYTNILYLNADLGHSEYIFKEDVKERDLKPFYVRRVSEKTYKFQCVMPEFMIDLLRIVKLSNYIKVSFKGKTIEANNFIFTPTWQKDSNIALVQFELHTNSIKKVGK